MSLDDAPEKLKTWRGDNNTVQSHIAVGKKSPISLPKQLSSQSGSLSYIQPAIHPARRFKLMEHFN